MHPANPREHEDLVSEFESILKGVEQTLNSTGMAVRRLTDEEMFLELKRAMNPLFRDDIRIPPAGTDDRLPQCAGTGGQYPYRRRPGNLHQDRWAPVLILCR